MEHARTKGESMSQPVPAHLSSSVGLQYISSKGWNWQGGEDGQVKVEICPLCKAGNWHFYVAVSGNKDGLWFCHRCGETGNLQTLQEACGDKVPGVTSRKEWAGKERTPDALPDVNSCHMALLSDAEALDYLLNVRGFSAEIINELKLGVKEKVYFRQAGETKALVIPYLVTGNTVFVKYRTLSPSPKDFACPAGWDAPLYNGEILVDGLKEIIFVEGEADAISLMSNGVRNVVGVPGANTKKAVWIEALDRIAPEKIFIMYDNDKVGQRAAQEMASRIGIDKCWKITLPKEYKDINEFFQKGGSLEVFEKLKNSATLFDINGVTSSKDALEQLEDELNGKVDLAPTYITQWPDLNRLVGFEDGDVIDIVAPEKVGKTTLGLNLLEHMVSAYGEDGLLICLEMTQARLARKWVSIVTGFEETLSAPGSEEAKVKKIELLDCIGKARAIQAGRTGDLYFAYPVLVKEPADIFKLIVDCVRRYGVKWVMFDNLQRLCDDTLKNQAHRTVHLSQISKGLTKIAKDYKIKLIRILQPKRIDKGSVISTNDVDGSSQVAKDCDAMLTMWRNATGSTKQSQYQADTQQPEEEQSFEALTWINVGLSRYSGGGKCRLFFDGARSQVKPYDETIKKLNEASAPQYNSIIATEAPVALAPLPQENISI